MASDFVPGSGDQSSVNTGGTGAVGPSDLYRRLLLSPMVPQAGILESRGLQSQRYSQLDAVMFSAVPKQLARAATLIYFPGLPMYPSLAIQGVTDDPRAVGVLVAPLGMENLIKGEIIAREASFAVGSTDPANDSNQYGRMVTVEGLNPRETEHGQRPDSYELQWALTVRMSGKKDSLRLDAEAKTPAAARVFDLMSHSDFLDSREQSFAVRSRQGGLPSCTQEISRTNVTDGIITAEVVLRDFLLRFESEYRSLASHN